MNVNDSITPYGPNPSLSRDTRRLSRALATLDHNRCFDVARIEAQAEGEAARCDGVTFVAKVAMNDVALLSQAEVQLAQLVPAATSRLQGIADIGALALADVVANAARRMR